jgi:hypothetical protein
MAVLGLTDFPGKGRKRCFSFPRSPCSLLHAGPSSAIIRRHCKQDSVNLAPLPGPRYYSRLVLHPRLKPAQWLGLYGSIRFQPFRSGSSGPF